MSNAAAPATEGPDRTDGPLHVAIIMDGNGRWAAARGLPRAEGHRRGVDALRRVVRAASELGILVASRDRNRRSVRPAQALHPQRSGDAASRWRQGTGDRRARRTGAGHLRALERSGRTDQGQYQASSRRRVQLRIAAGNRSSGAATGARSRGRQARSRIDRRRRARSVSRCARYSRPGFDHSHQRRAAAVEFPDVAGGLQRTRVRADPLAGFRQGRARKRDRRICQAGAPFRRSGRENRIVTEDEAASAAGVEQGSRNLLMRVIAASVLAPSAIAIAYAGGWLWLGLVTLAAIGLYVEWLTIVGARTPRVMAAGIVTLFGAAVCLEIGRIGATYVIIALGIIIVALLSPHRRGWAALGGCYAFAALVASVVVRLDQTYGFTAVMLILLVVWVTDIGGYFAGRGLGGPKLWPRVSPKKTWAGAIGGFAASLVVAAGFAVAGLGKTGPLLLLGAVLSTASQFGDLFESAVKRRFGVKDSSHIIPGHGGLLDRLDG